jgi:hypothetical protein
MSEGRCPNCGKVITCGNATIFQNGICTQCSKENTGINYLIMRNRIVKDKQAEEETYQRNRRSAIQEKFIKMEIENEQRKEKWAQQREQEKQYRAAEALRQKELEKLAKEVMAHFKQLDKILAMEEVDYPEFDLKKELYTEWYITTRFHYKLPLLDTPEGHQNDYLLVEDTLAPYVERENRELEREAERKREADAIREEKCRVNRARKAIKLQKETRSKKLMVMTFLFIVYVISQFWK